MFSWPSAEAPGLSPRGAWHSPRALLRGQQTPPHTGFYKALELRRVLHGQVYRGLLRIFYDIAGLYEGFTRDFAGL